MAKNPYQAEHDNEARRAQLVAIFGPDILQGLATDEPAPNRRPLGQRVVQEHKQRMREARQEREKAIMREAVQAEDKQLAYQRVVANAQNRHPSHPLDLAKAAAYAVEQGIVSPPSTIERLMAQAEQARKFEPMDAA